MSEVREYVSKEEQTATFRALKAKSGNQVRNCSHSWHALILPTQSLADDICQLRV